MSALPALVDSDDEFDAPEISSGELQINATPLGQMVLALKRDKDSYLSNVDKRIDLARTLWLRVMTDEAEQTNMRIRASELMMKADGGFIERKEIALNGGYREMLMAVKDKLKEPVRGEDIVEYAAFEEVLSD